MRRLAVLAALAAVAATGVRAETVFVGDTLVLEASSPCSRAIGAGESARFVYRPTGIGLGNGSDSHLAYIGLRSSYAMIVTGAPFRAKAPYAAQALSAVLTLKTGTGEILGWEQKPARAAPETRAIELVAEFRDYWAIPGCRVKIRGHLLRAKSNPEEID